jgi:hypothetical protein
VDREASVSWRLWLLVVLIVAEMVAGLVAAVLLSGSPT